MWSAGSGPAGTGAGNANAAWLASKRVWLLYVLLILFFRVLVSSFTSLSNVHGWTITAGLHTLVTYVLLHQMKGTPFDIGDQGGCAQLTHWEQIDEGDQYTRTRKFLMFVPIGLFFLAVHYDDYSYDSYEFFVNLAFLLIALVPKLAFSHKLRLFWTGGPQFASRAE